jgi:DNA polymerase-3 subunit delta
MSKETTVTAFQVLLHPQDFRPAGLCAVYGDEAYLQHEVRRVLAAQVLGTDSASYGVEVLPGKTVEWRDVVDALHERSLFSETQEVIVVIEEADPFVKLYREQLETLVEKFPADALLILEVSSWPGNTRLAKALAKSGLAVSCQIPEKGREATEFAKQLKEWLIQIAKREHQRELKRPAVDLLLELLPSQPGILYQEVARLALLVEPNVPIDANLVRDHVGGWRVRKTWDMIDAAADGRAADALLQLDRLIAAGEEPHAVLPQMASTLRRFAAAVRYYEQAESVRRPVSLRAALEASGMPVFKLNDAEDQLKQIGRQRARQLYQWLLAADLEMKGYNSPKDRARRVIETLIIRLSKQANPPRPTTR